MKERDQMQEQKTRKGREVGPGPEDKTSGLID